MTQNQRADLCNTPSFNAEQPHNHCTDRSNASAFCEMLGDQARWIRDMKHSRLVWQRSPRCTKSLRQAARELCKGTSLHLSQCFFMPPPRRLLTRRRDHDLYLMLDEARKQERNLKQRLTTKYQMFLAIWDRAMKTRQMSTTRTVLKVQRMFLSLGNKHSWDEDSKPQVGVG